MKISQGGKINRGKSVEENQLKESNRGSVTSNSGSRLDGKSAGRASLGRRKRMKFLFALHHFI